MFVTVMVVSMLRRLSLTRPLEPSKPSEIFFKRYGVPEYELTAITKKIGSKDTLTTAYEGNLGFRQLIQSKIEYQKAFEIAKKI